MDSTSYMREYTRKNNKEKINAQRRARYESNPTRREQIKEASREYHQENHDDVLQRRKDRREIIREQERSYNDNLLTKVLEQYAKKCARCGFNSDIRILQLDHVNGGGNRERREIGTRGIRRKALKNPELYQLLCPNCNWTKRFNLNEQNPRSDSRLITSALE